MSELPVAPVVGKHLIGLVHVFGLYAVDGLCLVILHVAAAVDDVPEHRAGRGGLVLLHDVHAEIAVAVPALGTLSGPRSRLHHALHLSHPLVEIGGHGLEQTLKISTSTHRSLHKGLV